jgi:CheY-like chemotaxis protein
LASTDPPPNFSKISLSIVGEAEAAVAPVCGGSSFDAVFIDINGNRMIEAVAEVTRLVCRDLAHRPPRLIVVKSSEMAKALQAALDA